MIIKPMVRSNICLNAHPAGCEKAVLDQIAYVKEKKKKRQSSLGPANVLVLGCSGGYGLASRIVAAFEYGAQTIGLSLERAGTESKGGTPGWYNNLAFDKAAAAEGLPCLTLNGDAYSDSVKDEVIQAAKERGIRFDLVVYSLASPVRTDPDTGVMYKSVIKPIGSSFTGRTFDPMTGALKEISAQPATEEEIAATVKVMGGEDWERWIAKLAIGGALAEGAITVAYSYIGPDVSQAIYRRGTIGKAKEHLEKTAAALNEKMELLEGAAYVSVNKGLITRASAVIPIIPLYLSVLYKVMKKRGTHEGCIEQMERLFAERLYAGACIPVDDQNRIRIDDWEMNSEVQAEVAAIMPQITQDNLKELSDFEGYRHDFLATSGFDIAGVDYEKDTPRLDAL